MSRDQEDYLSAFGPTLQFMRGIMPDKDVMRVLEQFGGQGIQIPKSHSSIRRETSKDSHILDVVSPNFARHLIDKWGGLYCHFPVEREFRIEFYLKNGLSINEICSRVCMSERGVRLAMSRIKKKRIARLKGKFS
ncbi:hypothetical protein JCM25156A_20500 [Komagataeibacter kakiaceti JCM 25156]